MSSVSSDYAGTNESSIVDSDLTMCIGDNLVKVRYMIMNGVIAKELLI